MATGKRAGKGPKQEAEPVKETAKDRVQEMFGGQQQPAELKIETTIPLPEHADAPDGELSAKSAKDAVDAILNALGTDKFPETVIPVPRNKNNGEAATCFILWDHVAKAAEKKKKAAKETAEAQGVFGDPSAYVPGETTLVYQAPAFSISIKKGDDTSMVDRELTTAVLKELAPNKWPELLERCKKPRAGPTQPIVSLK
jgi:hypothetical protein